MVTEFRGRGDEIRVYPLSFSEYLSAFKGSEEDAFNDYMIYGGLPRILSFPGDDRKAAYLSALFAETYLKDIIEHNHIRNTSELEDLVNVLASSVGSLTNPAKLQRTFRTRLHSDISDKTIKTYLDYLEDSFLIESASRYDIKGKHYIGSPLKYYFVDPGLRNARLGFRQIEETHLMENIIFTELKRRSFSVDVGVVDIRELSAGDKEKEGYQSKYERKRLEIDFIATKGSKKYYIQSAFVIPDRAKRQQEIKPLLNIDDSFKKIVIVGTYTKPVRDSNGILTMGIRQFLKDPDSLDI